MTYTGEMVLPKNAIPLHEEEMRDVDGGYTVAIMGSIIYVIGHNMSTPYTRTVTKGGRKYTISYKPTKAAIKAGKQLKMVGGTIFLGGVPKVGTIGSILLNLHKGYY